MKYSKFFTLLQSLSKKEMTRFSHFAKSPYHNKHVAVQHLVCYLNEIYPKFAGSAISDEILKQQSFQKSVPDAKLAVIFTYTKRLLESFLAQEAINAAPLEKQLKLIQELRRKDQSRIYEKELQKLRTNIQESPHRDSYMHLINYQWAAEADRHFSQGSKHVQDLNIQLKQESLDHYYIAEKLKDACEMVVRRKILRVDYNTPRFLDMIIQEVESNWAVYQQMPAIAIHYQLYQLLHQNPDYPFEEVTQAIEQSLDAFSYEEKQNLFNHLQNYCIERINKGIPAFLRKAFEIYQTQLENGLLLINGQLPEWHYKNIVTIALRLDEKEWTRNFIESFRAALPPSVAENAYRYNLASYYYSTNELEKALELLSIVEYSDVRYYIAAKSLLLRTYYDLGEHDPLISLSEAFKQFLKRNKVMTDYRVTAFKNLLSFTQKAMQIRMQVDYRSGDYIERAILQLEGQVKVTSALINRDWLEGKIREVVQMVD